MNPLNFPIPRLEVLLAIAGATLVSVLMMIWASKRQRDFRRKWPAIDDAEFVSRCSPGTDPETALKVRQIISEQLGIPYEHIHPEQEFIRDLDCC